MTQDDSRPLIYEALDLLLADLGWEHVEPSGDVSQNICRMMQGAGISRADLARNLDVSRAAVTQMLRSDNNLTLETLAKLAAACGHKTEVRFIPLTQEVSDGRNTA